MTLVLRVRGRRQIAAVLLAIGALPMLASLAMDLSHPQRIGAAMADSDLKFLEFNLSIPVFALVSLWEPARMCFWVGWAANLLMIAVYLYLAFVWHPFA